MGPRQRKYLKVLEEQFGYTSFREKQFEIIDRIVHSVKDVCGIMPTGHGKSICYQLPPLILNKTSLVISPLIALMEDQKHDLENRGIPVCCLNSMEDRSYEVQQKIVNNEFRVVYMTPEFAIDNRDMFQDMKKSECLCMVTVDEAHTVSHWGLSFRESYRDLACIRKWLTKKIPILALTATATDKVISDIVKVLKLNMYKVYKIDFDRPNLFLSIRPKKSTYQDLKPLLVRKGKPIKDSVIIYCLRKDDTETTASVVKRLGIPCSAYHAGMSDKKRTEIHHNFLENKITCIIATIAFGMGINKKDIRMVIHMNAPKNIEAYYQEIGRAGRDGEKAGCFAFYSGQDFAIQRFFLKDVEDKEYKRHCLREIAELKQFMYSTKCRRTELLGHFGQVHSGTCTNCDNCVKAASKKTKKKDFTDEAMMVLHTVNDLGGFYGGTVITDVVRGMKNKKIPWKGFKSKYYGKGHHYADSWWKALIMMLVNHDLLDEIPLEDRFGSKLAITEEGKDWLQLTSVMNPDSDAFPNLLWDVSPAMCQSA